jgi:ribosomal-protein-serine acetyltransferase
MVNARLVAERHRLRLAWETVAVPAFEWQLDDQVVLRLAECRFAEPYVTLVTANQAWLSRWEDWAEDLSHLPAAQAMFTRMLTGFADASRLPLLIVTEDQLAGYISLKIDHGQRTGSIGYWIGERFSGRGLVTRAVTAITHHGLNDLGLVRVEAPIAAGNTASSAVVRRAGFHLDGTLRAGHLVAGAPHDLQVWSRLPTDSQI